MSKRLNMKDSKLLQHIIEKLEKSSLVWKGDKELFELLFAPVAYGHEAENMRKRAIKPLHDIFKDSFAYDAKIFKKMAHNIRCGKFESEDRKSIVDYLSGLAFCEVSHIEKLVEKIPCKEPDEENYRSQFSHWKNRQTDRNIKDYKIKKSLQENFDFPQTLWGRSETQVIKELEPCIAKFIQKRTKKEIDLFTKMRKDFHLESAITEEELDDLQKIRGMSQQEIMVYISEHNPLREHRSQEFILKLISVLDAKGYFQLLLEDALTELSQLYRQSKEIKKITAHAYGSTEVNRPLDAFDILSTINSDDDNEVADMMTEAISNLRRHYLNEKDISTDSRREAVQKIFSYYEDVFTKNGEVHYYPGINLAYMTTIAEILFPSEIKPKYTIYEIATKVKESIKKDQNATNSTDQYYANIAKIEFNLLQNRTNALHEMEIFLEEFSEKISLVALDRTRRQMQFFVDSIKTETKHDIAEKMQQSIQIIDDFTAGQKAWERSK